jgi:mono/diheme cytochrome c family protein
MRRWVVLLAGSLLLPGPALAQDFAAKGFRIAPTTPRESTPEDVAAGKALYEDKCTQCHGAEGDGQGEMADLLDPRPRDFRRAIYKIRRTPQGELPTDEDLFRIIGNGMSETSMPRRASCRPMRTCSGSSATACPGPRCRRGGVC